MSCLYFLNSVRLVALTLIGNLFVKELSQNRSNETTLWYNHLFRLAFAAAAKKAKKANYTQTKTNRQQPFANIYAVIRQLAKN